jgi:glycosyltransferase involved in cell wall biosynthesis
MKLSFVIGNGNQGYMIRMCIYSLMKFNKDFIDEIIISDNSSTDYTVQFIKENKYKDITKVVTYDCPDDRNPKLHISYGIPWDLGLNACKNEYALLSHADIQWYGKYAEFFYKTVYDKRPFLFGYGGGNGTRTIHRIHEWGMIIHVPTWKSLGISFGGVSIGNKNYDTACYLYKKALEKKLSVISIAKDNGIEDNNEFLHHYGLGAKERKEWITGMAKNYSD